MLWRELKLPVTLSAYLFEDHIIHQIKYYDGGLVDKSEDHIEWDHQNSKRIYFNLTISWRSQIPQLKHNDTMTNPKVKLKPEQIKEEV